MNYYCPTVCIIILSCFHNGSIFGPRWGGGGGGGGAPPDPPSKTVLTHALSCAIQCLALPLHFSLLRACCLSVTTFSATTRNKAAKKRYQRVQCHTGLILKIAIFVKVYTAFKSYGLKTKRTSQYANEHGLPRPDSARFEHDGSSRSNTKGEYAVLVCQKHYLPT